MVKCIKLNFKIFFSLFIIIFTLGCKTYDVYYLHFDKDIYIIKEGEVSELNITFTKNGFDFDKNLLSFVIDDPNIAETDGEFIYGKSVGITEITVSYQEIYETSLIEITKNDVSLSTNKDSYLLITGPNSNRVQIETEVYKNNILVDAPLILYTSNNLEIVSISDNGLLTPLQKGKTTITLTYEKMVKLVEVEVLEEISNDILNILTEDNINIFGRAYNSNGFLHVDNPTSGIEVTFYGTSLFANVNVFGSNYIRVYVDNDKTGEFIPISTNSNFKIVDGLDDGLHRVKILKASEDATRIIFKNLYADTFYTSPNKPSLRIEFIGDSITAGYAIHGKPGDARTSKNSDSTSSYANITAMNLNTDISVIALQGICVSAYHWQPTINMESLYGYVSNSNKTPFDFNDYADIVVINLGTNDSSYISLIDSNYANQFSNDYQNFLEYIRTKRPNAYIIAIYGFMGKDQIIHNGILNAVDNLNDNKIMYYYDFVSNSSGGAGHPDITSNLTNGLKLANYIKELLQQL